MAAWMQRLCSGNTHKKRATFYFLGSLKSIGLICILKFEVHILLPPWASQTNLNGKCQSTNINVRRKETSKIENKEQICSDGFDGISSEVAFWSQLVIFLLLLISVITFAMVQQEA